MEEKKTDRRVRYTQMVVKESFVRLLREKPISKITVKEICEGADINRATFYAHYSDPYGLLHSIEEELICDIRRYLTESYERGDTDDAAMLCSIFRYIRNNADLCTALLSDYSDVHFQTLLRDLVQQALQLRLHSAGTFSEEDCGYILTFVLSGCVGVLRQWLECGMDKSDRELAALVLRLFYQGINM